MRTDDAIRALCPGVPVYAAAPVSLPATPFAVLSGQTDAPERDLFVTETGHAPQVRRATVLLNVWGGEGWTVERLRPLVRRLRAELADLITEHDDLPPLAGARRAAHNIEAATPTLKRPMFWLRLELTYME